MRVPGCLLVRHGGSADGFINLYVRYPEQRRAIILLCNRFIPVSVENDPCQSGRHVQLPAFRVREVFIANASQSH